MRWEYTGAEMTIRDLSASIDEVFEVQLYETELHPNERKRLRRSSTATSPIVLVYERVHEQTVSETIQEVM